MESICPICKKPYDGVVCTQCTVTDLDVSGLMASEGLHVETIEKEDDGATAFLVDLVSNRKIPITTPRCKVGRDDLNDIVISGDQSISRFHFVITKENNQYLVQDGKSRHGTFLNGNQITVPEPIHDGDVLKVGVSLFWFVIENVVLGSEPDKTSPVAMEHDEAELEFGAPEPTPARHIAASATQTNLPRADFGETGAFPALDLSGDLLHPEQDAVQMREPVTPHNDLMQSYKESVQQFAPDSAEQAPMAAPAVAEPEAAANATEEESGIPHSYRDPHDTAKVINNMGGDENFGNLSFFEPLNDVVSELGADSMHDKPDASAEPAQAAASSEETMLRSESADAEAAGGAESEQTTKAHEVDETETLGASTLEPADFNTETDFAPVHNNFENLFEAVLATVDLVSPESEHAETAAEVDQPEEVASAPAAVVPAPSPEMSDASLSSTLERLAETVEEAGSPTAPIPVKDDNLLSQMITEAYTSQFEEPIAADHENGGSENERSNKPTSNGAKSLMSTTKESLSGTVPDWCNRYFHGELSRLGKELTDLNDQVRSAQQKIKEVEGRVSLTKGLRNTLLTATGEDLVEGCGRVLSLLGWRIKISEDDKHELRVETDEKHTCIARVVWTETQADRTHLGQLSISQTRYWCEQGIEPKGILIVSRTNDNGPQALTASDMNSELADYASKKNVCLMTTLQLLAIFKDIALHDGSTDSARATIMASNGWLPGFNLEPADEKEEGSTNKLSSLLSA